MGKMIHLNAAFLISWIILFNQFTFAENRITSESENLQITTVPVDSLINPYLQTPTPTSVYVCWHASPGYESVVEYGTDETLGSIEMGTVHIFPDSSRWWHT